MSALHFFSTRMKESASLYMEIMYASVFSRLMADTVSDFPTYVKTNNPVCTAVTVW